MACVGLCEVVKCQVSRRWAWPRPERLEQRCGDGGRQEREKLGKVLRVDPHFPVLPIPVHGKRESSKHIPGVCVVVEKGITKVAGGKWREVCSTRFVYIIFMPLMAWDSHYNY